MSLTLPATTQHSDPLTTSQGVGWLTVYSQKSTNGFSSCCHREIKAQGAVLERHKPKPLIEGNDIRRLSINNYGEHAHRLIAYLASSEESVDQQMASQLPASEVLIHREPTKERNRN
jgi:hypothetical protein